MNKYTMYRYYKGEKENPFEIQLNNAEIDKSHLPPPECMINEYRLTVDEEARLQNSKMFWFYESVFDSEFEKMDSSDWYAFFCGNARERFMGLLSDEDYTKPSESKKAKIFDIWLNDYLFKEKLCDWSGAKDNWYREQYYKYYYE